MKPWHLDDEGDVTTEDGRTLAMFLDATDEEASVMVVAPKLLAALKGFLLGSPSDESLAAVVGEDVVREARAAIAKATGGAS